MVVLRQSDPIFGLVIAWAAYGIALKQSAIASVSGAALALCILALMLVVMELLRKYRSPQQA